MGIQLYDRHCADNLDTVDELGQQNRGRYANSETCFRCGNFCEEIVHAAIALDGDLIVFCTQNYKWINRLGSHNDAEDLGLPGWILSHSYFPVILDDQCARSPQCEDAPPGAAR